MPESHVLGRAWVEHAVLNARCSCGKLLSLTEGTIHDLEVLHEGHKLEAGV